MQRADEGRKRLTDGLVPYESVVPGNDATRGSRDARTSAAGQSSRQSRPLSTALRCATSASIERPLGQSSFRSRFVLTPVATRRSVGALRRAEGTRGRGYARKAQAERGENDRAARPVVLGRPMPDRAPATRRSDCQQTPCLIANPQSFSNNCWQRRASGFGEPGGGPRE